MPWENEDNDLLSVGTCNNKNSSLDPNENSADNISHTSVDSFDTPGDVFDGSNSPPASLQSIVMDDSKVSLDKKMPYIMMMGIVTMDVSPLTIHPFS